MTRFHAVTGENEWCGPTALALVTGRDRDEIAADVAAYREDGETAEDIDLMSAGDIDAMLEHYGVGFETTFKKYEHPRTTFARWAREATGTYIVSVTDGPGETGHFVAYSNGFVADNGCMADEDGMRWQDADISRRRVKRAYRIN